MFAESSGSLSQGQLVVSSAANAALYPTISALGMLTRLGFTEYEGPVHHQHARTHRRERKMDKVVEKNNKLTVCVCLDVWGVRLYL